MMTTLDDATGIYTMSDACGQVRFEPYGRKQLEIILEFNEGAGAAALDVCRAAFDYLFTETDTLIVRGFVENSNTNSRAFVAALGMTTKATFGDWIEKRMTRARWEVLNAGGNN